MTAPPGDRAYVMTLEYNADRRTFTLTGRAAHLPGLTLRLQTAWDPDAIPFFGEVRDDVPTYSDYDQAAGEVVTAYRDVFDHDDEYRPA